MLNTQRKGIDMTSKTEPTTDDLLRSLLIATDRDTACMMRQVRARIANRIRSAYWLGVGDTLDTVAHCAERRERSR